MADLFSITRDALVGLNVELVDIERSASGLLRVTIDHADGVTIGHCQDVSNQLSRLYEVENIDYKRLEVGSPGVDRALRTEADFLRFAGERVEVLLREANENGCKSFKGILISHPLADSSEASSFSSVSAQCDSERDGSKILFGIKCESSSSEHQSVVFTLDQADRAKLDPVLNFKGKSDESRNSFIS